jgi:hypothetical protein
VRPGLHPCDRRPRGGDSMNPVELLEGYYTLDTKKEVEQLAYLEELREQQRAAVAVTE